MKKVAFAWVTFWYDFDTEEEAVRYMNDNKRNGWYFELPPYDNGNGKWTVQVCKPYGKYNPGW